ncbi:MAG TPA: 3-hydroxyacyl-CoA dehydrogenase/enoyl-CoA hydratase family protein, partial [Bryobacterales bacterium]|nr:3-hydroxyacyl-CoA dehydrogenase/enoyl-CoA hydratase family protein [Bryobacterales bacterium]
LISSNTSGLPIASLAEDCSADFRAHWLGTHFFNPPRQMRLVELIPTAHTVPDVVAFLRDFCDRVLGKVVVFAKDRPNFIANRLYMFDLMNILRAMQAHGLSIEEVDALTGPLIGRPNTATFRLADFVGVDVCVYVSENLYRLVPEDEQVDIFLPPEFLNRMLEKRWVGDKAGQGFFKRAKNDRLVLDLDTLDYRPLRPPDLAGLDAARKIRDTGARIRQLISRDDRAGRFLWQTLSGLLLYAAARIPEITDDIVSIDKTLRFGFNWELGLFEIWDTIGVRESARRMEAEGRALPPLVQRLLGAGGDRFYEEEDGTRFFFDLATVAHQPVPAPPGVLTLVSLRDRHKRLLSNPAASLLDSGDGVVCFEIHSPGYAVDRDVLALLRASLEELASHYEALVIGHEGANFCAGLNYQYLLALAREGRWADLCRLLEDCQQAFAALRRSPKPVVAAVFGQTTGAGLELAFHAARVQAHAESYLGFPEASLGLLPVAGGIGEMLLRWTAGLAADADPLPNLKAAFETIAMAKVSSSAAEALDLRYLRPEDSVTMNRDRLLADARETALGLAQTGCVAPALPAMVPVWGRAGLAALKLSLYLMRQAGYITDYDARAGERLAYVLAGGDLPQPVAVPEGYLHEIAREAFLGLLGEPQTQQRLEHFLKTGKPLRN